MSATNVEREVLRRVFAAQVAAANDCKVIGVDGGHSRDADGGHCHCYSHRGEPWLRWRNRLGKPRDDHMWNAVLVPLRHSWVSDDLRALGAQRQPGHLLAYATSDADSFAGEEVEWALIARTLLGELEVNPPGVEIILRLRSENLAIRRQVAELIRQLRERFSNA